MFKVLAFLALVVSSATAHAINSGSIVKGTSGALGIVSPVKRCGGVGTPLNLRISDCEGYCRLRPGVVYNCEKDFMPSKSIVQNDVQQFSFYNADKLCIFTFVQALHLPP